MSQDRVFVRGSNTFERITLLSTLLGAFLFWLAMLALRVLALGYSVGWAILTGRGAGWIILALAGGACLRLSRTDGGVRVWIDREYTREHRTALNVALIAGCVLCAAHLSGVWPSLGWQWGDGRVWWIMPGSSGALSPLLSWLRFLCIGASAWVIWTPSQLLNWTLRTEQVHPKLRETPFAQGDPESVPGPDGKPYARARRGEPVTPSIVTNRPQDGGAL